MRGPDGEELVGSFTGDGPVDAIFHAINAATGVDARLREFRVDAVTGGQDALGETSVVLEVGGVTGAGQGVSTDILEAGARAYVRALSNAVRRHGMLAEREAAESPRPRSCGRRSHAVAVGRAGPAAGRPTSGRRRRPPAAPGGSRPTGPGCGAPGP